MDKKVGLLKFSIFTSLLFLHLKFEEFYFYLVMIAYIIFRKNSKTW